MIHALANLFNKRINLSWTQKLSHHRIISSCGRGGAACQRVMLELCFGSTIIVCKKWWSAAYICNFSLLKYGLLMRPKKAVNCLIFWDNHWRENSMQTPFVENCVCRYLECYCRTSVQSISNLVIAIKGSIFRNG